MADTAAALVIQLSADFNQFKKQMRDATGVFDAEGRKIERRQAQLKKNLEQGFGKFGTLLSAAAVVGFGRMVLNTADALKDASQQLGVTTQELQGLDYAARVSGASSEKLTQALGFLSDGLGEAQRGEGALAKYMRDNHIQMGDTITVLYDLANRTKAATTQQEKMNIATTAFGAKAGKTMVSFLDQGADGLRRLQAEASAKGQIWDPDTMERLDAAKDSFETLQKSLINIAAVPASEFINDMASFLNILAGGSWRDGLLALARMIPAIAGGIAGFMVGGPVGAVVGGAAGAAMGHFLIPRPAAAASGTGGAGAQARGAVPLSSTEAAQALKDANRISELLQQLGDDRIRSNEDYLGSLRDTVRAEDDALSQQTQGWSDAADIQKQIIAEMARLDIASINDRKDADLRALELRKKADLDRLTELHASLADMSEAEQSFAEQRVNIENATNQQIKQIQVNAAKDTAAVQTNGIQIADQLRSSLVDIGTAGLKGFGSLKDAAASALDQIAQMILQMYVLKPLVEGLLGPAGTSGGGFIGSLFGFADGGVMGPGGPRQLKRFAGGGMSRGAAIFGEAGPEAAVPLPDGRTIPVTLSIPDMPRGSRGGAGAVIVQNFDLSGAVVTQELYARMNQTAAVHAKAAIANYDQHLLPSRVAGLNKTPRKR